MFATGWVATMAYTSTTTAFSSSRKFTFKLQFVDSAGLRWRFIQNTIDFLDMLLQRRLKEALKESSKEVEDPFGKMLEKTVVVDVHSTVVGPYSHDLFTAAGIELLALLHSPFR